MEPLRGRVALVTGGSRGIGAAIVRRLAREGADVALTHVTPASKAKAEAVAAEVTALGRRALVIEADAADAGAVARSVEETVAGLGALDILVNNAGVFPYGPVEEITPEAVHHTLAVHAAAPLLAAGAASPHLPEGGRIISIGSALAERVPFPGIALYAMSKSALTGMTRALARELGPRGITVNLVQPGSTETDMNPADGEDADAQRALSALGRYLAPDEVAATVAHLAGPGGRGITGSVITVDAGTNA
ncbi:SDR family oxidoreductase [Streptomyces sp. NPDC000594]|uniref:SDR family NAD(P)-dependent oxidoreductase n=1 Tax=Streptomyces sp. NPDC000594 TaxID=3154261 RepID=UPI00332C208E